MTFAYIRDATVIELFDTDPAWPQDLDVRDVSDVRDIALGWTVDENGGFRPPDPPAPPVEPEPSPRAERVAAARAKVEAMNAGPSKVALQAVLDAIETEA